MLAVLALLSACATTSLTQKITLANQGITAVVTATDAALLSKSLDVATAKCISAMAHTAQPFLDAAGAASTTDATGAAKNLALAQATLNALQTYVAQPPGSAPKCL